MAAIAIAMMLSPSISSAAGPITLTTVEGQVIQIKPDARLYPRADINSQSVGLFAEQSDIKVLGRDGEWYLVRQTGRRIMYLSAMDVTTTGKQARPTPKSKPRPIERDTAASYSSTSSSDSDLMFGLGGFVDAINRNIGPTVVIRPWQNLTLQGMAGAGDYNTLEARAYLGSEIAQDTIGYFGLCFLHVETNTNIFGIDVDASGNGMGIVLGFERMITPDMSIYLDFTYTPMDLEATASFGPIDIKEETGYSPTKLGLGLVYYFMR